MPPSLSVAAERTGALIQTMRPRHWVKNTVVVAAPLFGLALDAHSLLRVGWAFIAFSMTASAFYIINDICDLEEDRNHPTKRHRPIASGQISISVATGASGALLSGGLIGSYIVAPWLGVTVAAYALLQTAYNMGMKDQPILDIMVIAGGFVLRGIGGAAAAGVAASGWFILCIGLLAFFLGLEKRKAELRDLGPEQETRSVLEDYSLSWLQRMESVVTASALIAYALWTLEGAQSVWMLATFPFVAYAIFRYQYLSENGVGENPVTALTKDSPILVAIMAWAVSSFVILVLTSEPVA